MSKDNAADILVYRDPRDVYYYAITKDVPWIPHQDVEVFIRWYKMETKKLDVNNTDYLVVQFEKLVCDYDNQVNRIEKYLSMNPNQHDSFKVCFDPSSSIKNVGIWKQCDDYSLDFNQIALYLKAFCYE